MDIIALRVVLGAAAILCCVGIFYAIAGTRQAISLKKGVYRFRAYLFIGEAICLAAVAVLLYQADLPVYKISGSVDSVQIRTEGKSYRSYVRIRVGSGAEVAVNTDGTSPYFRPGQSVDVRYQAETGYILKAMFLSPSGKQEALFNGIDTWKPYCWLLGGFIFLTVGFRRRSRDPEGAESA